MEALRLAAAASLATLGIGATNALAADAPIVSKQRLLQNRYAPVTIPGTGVKKGERLPSGSRLIVRTITLEGDQEARTHLKAPEGKRLVGLAPHGHVGFSVINRSSYVGRRTVAIRAFIAAEADGEVVGRIYALVK